MPSHLSSLLVEDGDMAAPVLHNYSPLFTYLVVSFGAAYLFSQQ